jgi:hypothetical protein
MDQLKKRKVHQIHKLELQKQAPLVDNFLPKENPDDCWIPDSTEVAIRKIEHLFATLEPLPKMCHHPDKDIRKRKRESTCWNLHQKQKKGPSG